MLLSILKDARRRSHRGQEGFTLVELLVVIAILGILAAIVLFNISGVNANAACNGMKTDGATIQGAADLYWNTYGVYPVGNAGVVPPATLPGAADAQTPAAGTTVNQAELLQANLLHSSTNGWNAPAPIPAMTEQFTYKASPPQGTVHGAFSSGSACTYN
ncbi:MAG: prepilin-type N-terminal cleavage/methylation domain-containing protein [Chloroflexi bacterium]|nr:MAG: prepilin-type N-terminal cleavage/methylation domain-containing protein [Chloroflexota bacterium]